MTIARLPSSCSLVRLGHNEFGVYMRSQLRASTTGERPDLDRDTVDEEEAVRDLYDLVHGVSELDWSVPPRRLRADLPTPCAIAIAGVAVSSIALVVQATGVPANVSRAIGAGVVEAAIAASPEIVSRLETDVAAIMNARGLVEQAAAILRLAESIGKVAPIDDVVATMTDELPPYQRMLTGLVVASQLALWAATDGTPAVAELILFGAAIAGLVISAEQADGICHPSDAYPAVGHVEPAKGAARP